MEGLSIFVLTLIIIAYSIAYTAVEVQRAQYKDDAEHYRDTVQRIYWWYERAPRGIYAFYWSKQALERG